MSGAERPAKWDVRTLLLFAPPFLLGLALRLYQLSSQILIDDEWHSLNFVLDKSFWTVLTTHGLGANCIPQNLINWLLLHSVGWSEITLSLTSVLFGVLGLALFPWLISRLSGKSVALYFSALLAISPCVIFYSRIGRPYSMVLFFGFLSILCLVLWVREGRPRLLLAYAFSGFASIYFHPYAALPVGVPLVALLGLAFARRGAPPDAPWISPKNILRTGILLAVLLAIFLGPAHVQNPWWRHVQGVSHVTAAGLWEFLSLLAGTRFAVTKLLFAGLVALGLRMWLQKDFRVGLLFLSMGAAFFALVLFATQDGMHAAIQIARYDIVLFPVAMWLAASALDSLLSRLPPAVPARFRIPLGLLLVAGLLAGSPLWRTFSLPNNFMHHSAFQDSYAPFHEAWSRVRALTPLPQMPKGRIPPFYFQLAADPSVPGIIEYPMYIGDPLNFYYYYQHSHRKPVAIGYVPDFPFAPLPSRNDFIYQTTPPDYVMSRARALGLEEQMRFANLLSLTQPGLLRETHRGWRLVVHRNLLQETLAVALNGPDANLVPPAMLPYFLKADLGEPVYSDAQLLVWKIP